MLSEQIDALAERFDDFKGGEIAITSEGIEWVVMCLRDLGDQARALEKHVVPAPARLTAVDFAGGKVVSLDSARSAARPAPAGGDAA